MKKSKLQPVQVMTLIIVSTLGVKVLIIQQEVVPVASQDAWISIILGSILILIFGLVAYKLARLYPEKDLPEIIMLIGGKILGRVLLLPLLAYGLLMVSLNIRIFTEALKLFLLDKTPNYAIIALMTLVVISVVKRGIHNIAASIDLIVPTLLIILPLLIILAVLQQPDMSNIKPILFQNTENVLRGAVPAMRSMTGYGAVLYIICCTTEPDSTLKWYLLGLIIPMILFTELTVTAILSFGPQEVRYMLFPTLMLSKAIEFPATLLERLEALLIIVWIPAAFASASVYSYISVRNFATFLGIAPEYEKQIAYSHVVPIIIISMMSGNVLELFKFVEMAEFLGLALGLGFLPLLTLYTVIKRRRNKRR